MSAAGYGKVMTSTLENEDAQHFYRRLGYETLGKFLPFDTEYELIMGKEPEANETHIEKINRSFEKQAEKFDTSKYHLSKKEYTDYFINAVNCTKNDIVLEVAAGTSICGRALAPYAKRIVCIDATEAMLEAGKSKAESGNINNIEFKYGLAESLPFEDETFDTVISRLAFHHFASADKPFKEMRRVLKKGGKLVIWDMESAEEELRDINDKVERMRDPSHNRILSREEFLALYGSDFEMTVTERKEIPVKLDGWMELTDTPEPVRKQIYAVMENELCGKEKAGFCPYGKDGEIFFNHKWLLLVGIKK